MTDQADSMPNDSDKSEKDTNGQVRLTIRPAISSIGWTKMWIWLLGSGDPVPKEERSACSGEEEK